MQLSEMVGEVAGYLGEPGKAYTTATEITLSLNLAQDELEALLHPKTLQATAHELIDTDTGTTTSGAETYPLPSNFLEAISLELDGYTARQVKPEEKAAVDGSNTWTTPVASDPAFYIEGSDLHFFPHTAVMAYSLCYVKHPARLQSDTDTSNFGPEWDKVLIDLATNIRAKKMGAALQGGEQIAKEHRDEAMQTIGARNAKYARPER